MIVMKVCRASIAVLALLSAFSAEAACDRPSATAPAVPNGATADDATMKQAHDSIQAYVVQLEAYKACLKAQSDSAPAGTAEEQRVAWVAQGDAAVDAANVLAAQFSVALKQFKERPGQSPAKP